MMNRNNSSQCQKLFSYFEILKKKLLSKSQVLIMPVRNNQSNFEFRPIRKQYFEILIHFYALAKKRDFYTWFFFTFEDEEAA